MHLTVCEYISFNVSLFPADVTLAVVKNPDDSNAVNRLARCMDALQAMRIIWPSAGRQWEILEGSKGSMFYARAQQIEPTTRQDAGNRTKRPAEDEPERDLHNSFPASLLPLPGLGNVKGKSRLQSSGNFQEHLPNLGTSTSHSFSAPKLPEFPISSSYVEFPTANQTPMLSTSRQQWHAPSNMPYTDGMAGRSTSQTNGQPPPASLQVPYFSAPQSTQPAQPGADMPVMQFWDNTLSWDGFGDSSALSAYLNNIPAATYAPHSVAKRPPQAFAFDEFDRSRPQGMKGPVYTYGMSDPSSFFP